jgi:hypothetical protein
MQEHERNPRYVSLPTLTASLLSSYMANLFCEANEWGIIAAGLVYLGALIGPIIIKRTFFTNDENWSEKRRHRNHISRLP